MIYLEKWWYPDKTCQEWQGQGYRHCKLAKQEDEIPSGYLTVRHGKIHHAIGKPSTVFLWAIYTMAMLNNQRVI